jgi:elongator complex protein 5
LLEGLTTFNLGTTERQKLAKDSTELPFYQAQEFGEGAARGGAIVYEFEKDDDFDEEDPFEDPF